jgi:prepilin-type N-terminal cleavage/methylation domain-containing protein
MMQLKHTLPTTGFTLAELLVTVGLIGIVSALTIPSVLQGAEVAQRRAIFKETIRMISDAAETLTADPNAPTGFYAAFSTRLKILESGITAADGWVLLQNGARLYSLNNAFNRCDTVGIDLNGTAPPNRIGEDVVGIVVSWAPNNVVSGMTASTAVFTGGMVKPIIDSYLGGWAGNEAYFAELSK